MLAWLLNAALLLPAAHARPSPHEELNETLESIAQATARKKKLSQENAAVQKELSALQKDTVELAERLRADEQRLQELEEKQAILQAEADEKRKGLEQRRTQLAAITQAMIRLGYTPEQAVAAMPGEYAQMLQTARTLGIAVASLKEEAEDLRHQLEELESLQRKIKSNHEKLLKEKKLLTRRQENMNGKLAERSALHKKLHSAHQEESDRLAKLSKRSASLQELIGSLERSAPVTSRPSSPDIVAAPSRPSTQKLRSFTQAKGRIRLPVSGKLAGKFGQQKGKNDSYKGVVIETREHAQVTSPYDGEVVYTGPFLTYGNLIIIRHSDQFHTLLAGFERIDCIPGQFLLEGEPIGAMGTRSSGGTRLYLELRERNRPINPAPWIAGLDGLGHG